MEQADAQVCTNKQLLERLQLTEAGGDSLIGALTAEQEARARAELRLASSQRVHGDHVAVLGLFAQQQTGAKEVRGVPSPSSRAACRSDSLQHKA